jgi:hypothetical protein
VSGRKCHLLVDTQGLLQKVVVHPAGMHGRIDTSSQNAQSGTPPVTDKIDFKGCP